MELFYTTDFFKWTFVCTIRTMGLDTGSDVSTRDQYGSENNLRQGYRELEGIHSEEYTISMVPTGKASSSKPTFEL